LNLELHLVEYLHHLLEHDPAAGLRAWADAFERALRAWDAERCRILLKEMRRGDRDLSPRGRGLALNREGQWLIQRGEYETAIARLERSLAVFEDSGDTLGMTQVLNELGNVYQATGEWRQAEDYYRRALPLQREEGDRRQEAITLNNLAVVLGDQGQVEEAFDTLQRSLALLRDVGSQDEIGRTLLNLAKFAVHLGQVEAVGDYYHEALEILRAAGDRTGEIYALNGLGNHYKRLGNLTLGTTYYVQSLELAQEVGNLRDQEQALGNLGTIYHRRGEWATAERYYRQACEICRGLNDEAGMAVWLGNLALALGLQDREVEARPLLERQIEIHRRHKNRVGEGTALLNLATHYRDVDDFDTAEKYFQEAAGVAREIRRPNLEARVHAAWGYVRWHQGRFEEAQEMFERALALYRAQDDPRGQLTALYKLAGMDYERQRWATARSFAEAAWDVGAPLDIPYWHSRVLWLLGEIAFEQGDDQGAAYLAETAVRARRAGDEDRYEASVRSILERVAAYSEAGESNRAIDVCQQALAVWRQEANADLTAEIRTQFEEIVTRLASPSDRATG
jgi:tetratricopeptide (TPR) repeat protein